MNGKNRKTIKNDVILKAFLYYGKNFAKMIRENSLLAYKRFYSTNGLF